jgi:hypothetical protein
MPKPKPNSKGGRPSLHCTELTCPTYHPMFPAHQWLYPRNGQAGVARCLRNGCSASENVDAVDYGGYPPGYQWKVPSFSRKGDIE